MAWERLKTDYKDAVWSGLRKFIPIDNGDGSYSVKDVTQYTVYDESFFGAYDANRINTAVNAIMAALENGTDLYEVFTEFFENQKVEFDKRANLDQSTACATVRRVHLMNARMLLSLHQFPASMLWAVLKNTCE